MDAIGETFWTMTQLLQLPRCCLHQRGYGARPKSEETSLKFQNRPEFMLGTSTIPRRVYQRLIVIEAQTDRCCST